MSGRPDRVVFVTHDDAGTRWLARQLVEHGVVDELWIERGAPSSRFVFRRLRRVGLREFLFQVWLSRWFRRRVRALLPHVRLPPHRNIRSLNAVCIPPNTLVVGFGTSICSAATLARAPLGILNLHTGALPAFRGVKSELWSLLEERHGRRTAGWTVHYMTAKLDAGDIVASGEVDLAAAEDPAHLRVLLLRAAAPVLIGLLARVRQGGIVNRRSQIAADARYFTTPTAREWREWLDWKEVRLQRQNRSAAP